MDRRETRQARVGGVEEIMLGYKITALPLASLPSHRPLRLQESATNTNLKHETDVGGDVVGPPGILHNIEVEMINKIRMRSDIFFVGERKKLSHVGLLINANGKFSRYVDEGPHEASSSTFSSWHIGLPHIVGQLPHKMNHWKYSTPGDLWMLVLVDEITGPLSSSPPLTSTPLGGPAVWVASTCGGAVYNE
ncbi:hypothetical protein HZH68_003273 [Vespula germanica]|uniref:Uncharacterized protein n=1 Tax=Vespula germanica TaxID=30212 RepID=A0A834NNU8_VESGE|nr:hypothetical protein HZH68_003273 [Vespula germanica]